MGVRLDSEPGLVIHSRPYRENSVLIELYTLNYGRVSAVARLARKSASRSRGVYQPFTLLKLSLRQGKSELWQLTEAFIQRPPFMFEVPAIFSATYLNELLYYLVRVNESDPELFAGYIRALESLERGGNEFITLREFEGVLLKSLGYAISYETSEGESLVEDRVYCYVPRCGFIVDDGQSSVSYSGRALLKIKAGNLEDKDSRKALKSLNTSIIDSLLNGRVLKSRELYAQFLMVK